MEEEIIYFYNVKDGKYYRSRYTHRWLNNLQQQCKKQKEVIDKAIEYIEKDYYSKNTFDIDNIGMTTNKLLQVRNILKRGVRMKIEDYFKYYIQGSDHYLIPKDVFDELFNEMENWKEEAKELKKQLEEAQENIILLKASKPMLEYKKALEENQQKEFIDYLEDLIKQNETVVEVSKYGLPKNCSKLLIDFYKEILSKYKEIIGGKEKNNKHIATLN